MHLGNIGEIAVKVVSYRHRGKHGVGVVSGANGLIAGDAAPGLPGDLRRILKSIRHCRGCARRWRKIPRPVAQRYRV